MKNTITISTYEVTNGKAFPESRVTNWLATDGALIARGDTEADAKANLERVLRMRGMLA